jgi:hypothetical protein
MGIATARALLDELRGRSFVQPTFHTDLVLRASTASPPAPQGKVASPRRNVRKPAGKR